MKILEGEIGWNITLRNVQELESFALNSPGGSLYEGLALFDLVKGMGKDVGCIGICASAATLPLLASKTRWGTPNSRYLIHNPSNWTEGTAAQIEKTAAELKSEQDRAVELYAEHLTASAEEIQALMNEEKFISAKEALALGLILEIKDVENVELSDAYRSEWYYYDFKMKHMKTQDPKKPEAVTMSALEKMLKPILSALKIGTKMVVVTDVNGVALDFAEVETPEAIAVGAKVSVDGNASASGEYVMPSGETYVVEAGELTEIKNDDEDMRAENEALKAENEALKAENAEMSAKHIEFKANLEKINAKMQGQKPEPNTPPVAKEQQTGGFKFKSKRRK